MSAKFTCQFTMTDPEAWVRTSIYDYAQEAISHLAGVVWKVGDYQTGGVIRDVNGNKIGSWKLR